MIALMQRVTEAKVCVERAIIGQIGEGLLVLLGVERTDQTRHATRLAERVLAYRVFGDADDKMNLSVCDISGHVLVVPQFTLAANTQKGNRPSLQQAAEPELGFELYAVFCERLRMSLKTIETGRFGANMQVSLVNDGPVTFWLQV